MRFRTGVVVGLLPLFGVAAFATSALQRRTNGSYENSNQSLQLPVTVKQLQPENNHNVELLCGTASVTPPNILNGFECTLKNNTQKGITAANIIYATVLEEAEKPKTHETKFY